VPSRQRAHAVRLAQAAAVLAGGGRIWPSADVLGVDGWLRREVERAALAAPEDWPRLLTDTEEWFLWRQCALDATREFALLDGAALAQSLREAGELAADYRVRAAPAPPESEAALLREVEHAFTERCRALGAGGLSALAEQLLGAPAPANPPLLLRGFDTVPPRLHSLASARGDAEAANRPIGGAPSGAREAPRVVRPAQGEAELECIAEWCREQLEQRADARLLVVLPGTSGRRERLAALIRQALDPRSVLATADASAALVGIEGGSPLAQQPLIRQALVTLSFLAGAASDYARVSGWLRSPHWADPPPPVRAALDLQLRERALVTLGLREFLGALQLVPAELKGAARQIDAHLTRASTLLGERPVSPRVWSERISAALSAALWPGLAATESAGAQTLMRWHELLEDFGDLDASTGALERSHALALLAELAFRSRYRGADEDVTVAISAVLADPVVEYDGIWVGGLHSEVFPQPVQPNPFLPLAAQIAARLPAASAAGRLTQARSLLGAWRARTPELVLSAPRHEGDLELLPSPLLAGAGGEVAPRPSGWLPGRLHREGMTEMFPDTSGRPFSARLPLPRGTRALDLQNQCPFRAYAELRLGSARPETSEPGIAANRRGEFLHEALARLWRRLGDSRGLATLGAEGLRPLIAECVAEAAQETLLRQSGRRARRHGEGQFDLFAAVPATVVRECRRAERLIAELCELESRRAPFRVTATELDAQLTLAGATVRMRIDRVDECDAGGRAILDYKTGQHLGADWYGERPTHPQLLAYLAALGEDITALATVSVSARKLRFDGIAREAGLLPEVRALKAARGAPSEGAADAWRRQQRTWVALIERLIEGFLAGDAAVDPKPGACKYCHVIDICRVLERGGGDVAAAGEGTDE